MDKGEGEEWAALWTDDGAFTGIPDPATGNDQLQALPRQFVEVGNGKFRHDISNVVMTEGDRGTVRLRAYSRVTAWGEGGGSLLSFAETAFELVREGDGWLIRSLHADMGP